MENERREEDAAHFEQAIHVLVFALRVGQAVILDL